MALTKTDVLDAALAILDAYGLADLTMRRLGGALGVRAGALYHHVPNKQTLLAGVADRILGPVRIPEGPWRPALEAWACGLRGALLDHRDAADLVSTARAMGLAESDAVAGPAARLVAAGLAGSDAYAAAASVLHFTLGHVAEEQARRDWELFGKPDPARAATATPASFALGVDLLLDGIDARLARR